MHRHTALDVATEKADKDADLLATEKKIFSMRCVIHRIA